MLKTADGADANEWSLIHSAKRGESDEMYVPTHHSTRILMPKPTRRDRRPCFVPNSDLWARPPEEDDKSDSVFTDKETIALSGSSTGSKEDYVAEEAERDNEGVPSVEEMALPFHLGSQERKSGDSDEDEDHEQTTDADDYEEPGAKNEHKGNDMDRNDATIKVEATAARLMVTIGKITTTGKEAV
jgi:hypothetical protein